MLEQAVRRFDEAQQRRWWLAHPIAVVRKYADDRGSAFAGLVTFQVFLGMLPLLVVVLTVLGRWIDGADEATEAAVESTLRQLPVVGDHIRDDLAGIEASGPWVVVSVVGLLYTASGIYHSLQLAMNQAWNVEGIHRQGWVSRHLRAGLLFTLVIAAAIGTGLLRGTRGPLAWGPSILAQLASALASIVIAQLLLLAVFRIVVAPVVPLHRLIPAAALAGLLWELLQRIGTWLVAEQVGDAITLYGTIGFVVVLLFWINLLARSAVFANEWAVVSWDRLWPRRIAQPPLTRADRIVIERLARNERRRPEAHIDVRFDESADRAR